MRWAMGGSRLPSLEAGKTLHCPAPLPDESCAALGRCCAVGALAVASRCSPGIRRGRGCKGLPWDQNLQVPFRSVYIEGLCSGAAACVSRSVVYSSSLLHSPVASQPRLRRGVWRWATPRVMEERRGRRDRLCGRVQRYRRRHPAIRRARPGCVRCSSARCCSVVRRRRASQAPRASGGGRVVVVGAPFAADVWRRAPRATALRAHHALLGPPSGHSGLALRPRRHTICRNSGRKALARHAAVG